MTLPKLKKWRAVFALDCHGGFVIEALTEEEAIEKFQGLKAEELFHRSQVQNIRYLGIIPATKISTLKKDLP